MLFRSSNVTTPFYCASTCLAVPNGASSPEAGVLPVGVVFLGVAGPPPTAGVAVETRGGGSGGGGALRVAVGGVLFRCPLCGAEGLRRGYTAPPKEDMKVGVWAR